MSASYRSRCACGLEGPRASGFTWAAEPARCSESDRALLDLYDEIASSPELYLDMDL